MDFLVAQLFFDISQYKHRDLWKQGQPVWGALHELKRYFEAYGKMEIEVDMPRGTFFQNSERIAIGEGTSIEPGVLIRGPCIIGKNCTISQGAYIREYSIVGDRCSIGHSAELKASIMLNDAALTHFAYAGDSIIGNRANLGAGVKCANVRLDREEVTVSFDNALVKSGLKKFGAIIGDDVQVGCNCVFNPGTLLGKESVCQPLLNVGGYIPPRSLVRGGRDIHIEQNRPSHV